MKTFICSVFLLGLGLGLALALSWGPDQARVLALALGPGSSYKAVFPLIRPDLATIAVRAQELGFWIRVQCGLNVSYLHGTELCPACTPEKEESFFGFPQLYLDSDLFLVRLDEEGYRMGIRRSAEVRGAYEVIFTPKREMPLQAIETEALGWLQRLGIVQAQAQTASLEFAELVPQEKPRPPEGVRLDSLLYALTLAPDWHEFARARGFTLFGLRIKVIVELYDPQVLPQGYYLLVEARSQDLMRVQVPVSELIRLSSDPTVKFVRLPYEPHEAGGG
ncbi:TPA: hypothetical protein EYP12_02735 [Candidatus Bipolaricaulota bacterium]|nr:hypothetical protein [Candidatus Bipolaricaulota bacterium]